MSLGVAACTAIVVGNAFLGLESATVPAGNVNDPKRTIPCSTILGLQSPRYYMYLAQLP